MTCTKEIAQDWKDKLETIGADYLRKEKLVQSELHMKHWLSRKGGVRIFPNSLLKNDKWIKGHLDKKHLAMLLGAAYVGYKDNKSEKVDEYKGGLTDRIVKSKGNWTKEEVILTWKDSFDYMKLVDPNFSYSLSSSNKEQAVNTMKKNGANADIYFSIGGATIKSTLKVFVKKWSNTRYGVYLTNWRCLLTDSYDFKIDTPLDWLKSQSGVFSESHCVEKQGFAKPFTIRSEWEHKPKRLNEALYFAEVR